MEQADRIGTAVHVEIPEGVRLTFALAGPAARLAAYLVDTGLRLVLFIGLIVGASCAFPVLQIGGGSTALVLLALFFMEWGYSFAFEALWNGQTPGKRALGLRVIREGGYTIRPYDAFVRNLLRAADVLPAFYGVGLVSMAATHRLQRLGDLAAGTMVIHERRHRLRTETADLLGAPPISPDEIESSFRPTERTLDLIHAFALRRDQLPRGRGREIASILAAPLARRLRWHAKAELEAAPDHVLLRVFRTFHERRQGPS